MRSTAFWCLKINVIFPVCFSFVFLRFTALNTPATIREAKVWVWRCSSDGVELRGEDEMGDV